MRWLYHLVSSGDSLTFPYAPASLAREGFIHASFRDQVVESARLHFAPGQELKVLRIDPRRIGASMSLAQTPRGALPHIHAELSEDAVRETMRLDALSSTPDRVTGTRFAFVAFDGMTLLDLIGVLDPISRIASMGFDPSATYEVVAADERLVWSGFAAELRVQRVRPDLREFDVLIVAGGHGTRALERAPEVVAWLSGFPSNRIVASVCTGALLLGATGRLRGKRAATHESALEDLARHGATAVRERVVDEGTVVTAGGVTSGIDLGLHLVRRLEGDKTADAIARQMEWPTSG